MALVLASASPRRRELLQNAGIPFIIQASKIPELPLEGEAPQACAERLAREKALVVFHKLKEITSTWWDCPYRSCIACCRRTALSNSVSALQSRCPNDGLS